MKNFARWIRAAIGVDRSASEIAHAKRLRDAGVISQDEYEALIEKAVNG